MALLDLFSKRQRRLRGEVPDVYVYDELSNQLRVQIVHLLRDMLGQYRNDHYFGPVPRTVHDLYRTVVDALAREYGRFQLTDTGLGERDYSSELFNFFLQTKDVEQAFDVIELCTRVADRGTREYRYLERQDFNQRVDSGIAELNSRLREHGVGFQYEDGELIRIDSDLLHSEAVKPALTLLRTRKFEGPREEFLSSYEHYRHRRYESALNESLKAFESTMKVICDKHGWTYDKTATAKNLVNVCFQNHLIDEFWQSHISALRNTLENGIATARNKLGGHGKGNDQRVIPGSLVAYVLHMTAATIVFLIQSSNALSQ